MSGNDQESFANEESRPEKLDRRVRRTREVLGDALVALIQEKAFDDITVQEVLDRAGVGRSTFYTHYSDKQDLFLSDVEEFFEGMSTLLARRNAPPRRLAPVWELFAHVAEVRDFHAALVASGKAAEVRELACGTFARSIAERLAFAGVEMAPTERRALAVALAAALFAMLEWWMDRGRELSPEAMDALFHRLAWRGVRPSAGVKRA